MRKKIIDQQLQILKDETWSMEKGTIVLEHIIKWHSWERMGKGYTYSYAK